MKHSHLAGAGCLLGSLLLWACSGGGGSGNNSGSGGDGSGGDGASSASGGDGAGAASGNEGGAPGEGGGSGPQGGTGGTPGSGGQPSNGGQSNTGGTPANGGAGGRPNTGGTPSTGGARSGGSAGSATPAPCVAPCDNFETYTAGQRPGGSWNGFDVSGTGALSVDTGKAYSGTKAVKFTASPGGGNAQMRFGAAQGSEVYMRAWIWLDKLVSGAGVFHWNFMRVEGGGNYVVTGGNANANTFTHGIFGGRDCFAHGGMRIPVGKWTCVEFHVNGATDLSETYYNGTVDEITQCIGGSTIAGSCLTGASDGWTIPNADIVKFGISYAHELNAPITLWMDDIVVSKTRVGCQ